MFFDHAIGSQFEYNIFNIHKYQSLQNPSMQYSYTIMKGGHTSYMSKEYYFSCNMFETSLVHRQMKTILFIVEF